jgi:ribonuclease P protein component
MHILKNEKVNKSKVAVVVSRKVDKSAVKRNRIRRRIYALARPKLSLMKSPAELVITVYSNELASMPAEHVAGAIDELFKKAKL